MISKALLLLGLVALFGQISGVPLPQEGKLGQKIKVLNNYFILLSPLFRFISIILEVVYIIVYLFHFFFDQKSTYLNLKPLN